MQFLETGRLKIVLPHYTAKSLSTANERIFIHYPHRQYLARRVRTVVDYLLDQFQTSTHASFDAPQKNITERFAAS
jgi:LysR family transcriptional regulator, transcriptional activator for dmlA